MNILEFFAKAPFESEVIDFTDKILEKGSELEKNILCFELLRHMKFDKELCESLLDKIFASGVDINKVSHPDYDTSLLLYACSMAFYRDPIKYLIKKNIVIQRNEYNYITERNIHLDIPELGNYILALR